VLTTSDLYHRFQSTHLALFGTRLDDAAEVVNAYATVFCEDGAIPSFIQPMTEGELRPSSFRDCALFGGATPVYDADALAEGQAIQGPALVDEPDTVIGGAPGATLIVEPGGTLRMTLGT